METTRAQLDSTRGQRKDSATFGNFITYNDGTTAICRTLVNFLP